MFLTKITSQHHNDFSGILECEHCKTEEKLTTGYNDTNYHQNVIPSFHCKNCGKNRNGEEKKEEPV